MDIDERHLDRWCRVVLCQTVHPGAEAKPFKDSILETCDMRNDDIARQVKLRVLGAVSDLPAADVRDHKDCWDNFMAPRSVRSAANAAVSTPNPEYRMMWLTSHKDRPRQR